MCLCSCGIEKKIIRHSLLSGDTKSCGCYRKEKTAKLAAVRTPRQKLAHLREDKKCPQCNKTKSVEAFPKNVTTSDGYGAYCKPCHNLTSRENRRINHGNRGYHLKRRYGITQEDFDRLVAGQEGKCAICQTLPSGIKPWHVDHNHATGKIRGVLCHHCNTGLGNLKDNVAVLKRAIAYLEKSNES